MSSPIQSRFVSQALTKPWSTEHGDSAPPAVRTTSITGAVITAKFRAISTNLETEHLDFDALTAELEADPRNKAELEAAGNWAADFLYPGEESTLRTARLRKGLSQKQLAAMIGTSQPHVANLEKSGNDIMLSTAQKLCEALDIDFGRLPAMIDRQRALNAQKELK